jgi:hypothetical protein
VERKRYRAGHKLDDLCRACKIVRVHTVFATGPEGEPLRVVCDYCGSQHNYRGGDRPPTRRSGAVAGPRPASGVPFELVSERERSEPPMSVEGSQGSGQDLELLLRRIIREEAGLTPVTPAEKWRGGEVVLRPGRPGLQEKTMPIETLFHKIVMLRNRLRVLEQQINNTELPANLKAKLQGYITACYGSLTSFNVLFAEEEDRFHGSGGSAGKS